MHRLGTLCESMAGPPKTVCRLPNCELWYSHHSRFYSFVRPGPVAMNCRN